MKNNNDVNDEIKNNKKKFRYCIQCGAQTTNIELNTCPKCGAKLPNFN